MITAADKTDQADGPDDADNDWQTIKVGLRPSVVSPDIFPHFLSVSLFPSTKRSISTSSNGSEELRLPPVKLKSDSEHSQKSVKIELDV